MIDPMALLLDPVRLASLALIPAWVIGARRWRSWRSRDARRAVLARLDALPRSRWGQPS